MIKVEDLSFTYTGGTKPALEGVSLTLENRAWVAVTGPIGSGKTTLCKILKGLLEPSSGRVDFTEPHEDSSMRPTLVAIRTTRSSEPPWKRMWYSVWRTLVSRNPK